MSESTSPKVDQPVAAAEPALNPFHDPIALSEPPTAKPNSEPSEMTTHVSNDTSATPLSAQHPETPGTTNTTSPAPRTVPTESPIASPPAVPAPVRNDAAVDPQIASLVAIFPNFDHDLLRDVLNECNGNEDQAVDILLGMSDPNHVPSTNVANVSGHLFWYCPALSLRGITSSFLEP